MWRRSLIHQSKLIVFALALTISTAAPRPVVADDSVRLRVPTIDGRTAAEHDEQMQRARGPKATRLPETNDQAGSTAPVVQRVEGSPRMLPPDDPDLLRERRLVEFRAAAQAALRENPEDPAKALEIIGELLDALKQADAASATTDSASGEAK